MIKPYAFWKSEVFFWNREEGKGKIYNIVVLCDKNIYLNMGERKSSSVVRLETNSKSTKKT